MEHFKIGMGDFLKNAGLVGMQYMLEKAGARNDRDYGIEDQGIWLRPEFALEADWTDMYFKAFIEYFGPNTVYQAVLDKISECLEKLKCGNWSFSKDEKETLKFLNEKILSSSYQSGFANIQQKIEHPDVYLQLKEHKLNAKMTQEDLSKRLEELRDFITQPLCKETFTMKSIIYNYINRFWDGKCFLNQTNAKKDMKELFEKDFSVPMRDYWKKEHKKPKDICIDCGEPLDAKEKVSIAFMNDMGDDLSRKRSAFWNCKVDAYLCPTCAFVYALSPLGFQLIGNKFLFINTNESMQELISQNRKKSNGLMESQKQKDEKYPAWFSRIMTIVLYKKVKELSNIQVILRGRNVEEGYRFSIINKEILELIDHPKIKEYLELLGKHPVLKIGNEYLNIYELVVLNILQYRSQYTLINRLLKASLEYEGAMWFAYAVYYIQVQVSNKMRNGAKIGGKRIMNVFYMRDKGYELRKALLASKGTNSDDSLRGTVYQLTNALSVRNTEKFLEIVLRLYSSNKTPMPDGFVQMLSSKDIFMEYGYAFVLGLRGSHKDNQPENNLKDEEGEGKVS